MMNLTGRLTTTLTGATVLAIAVGLAPAQAALLNFSFTDQGGRNGSFVLDTTVEDTDSSESGLFNGAISEFVFNGASYAISDVEVAVDEPAIGVVSLFAGDADNSLGFIMTDHFFRNGQLSSDPENYYLFRGNLAGFGVGQGFVDQFSVTPAAAASVPEPTTAIGVLALGALGAGSWLQRKWKREN